MKKTQIILNKIKSKQDYWWNAFQYNQHFGTKEAQNKAYGSYTALRDLLDSLKRELKE